MRVSGDCSAMTHLFDGYALLVKARFKVCDVTHSA